MEEKLLKKMPPSKGSPEGFDWVTSKLACFFKAIKSFFFEYFWRKNLNLFPNSPRVLSRKNFSYNRRIKSAFQSIQRVLAAIDQLFR